MNSTRRSGLYPEDLEPEKLEQLLRDGYTISPNSGRLRKKLGRKKSSGMFSKHRAKKYTKFAMWALLILAFLVSLVIILPEMAVQNNPNVPKNAQGQPLRR
ncbi:MAG: hypothetical protein ABI763_07940 [Bacteroidota bacterium]